MKLRALVWVVEVRDRDTTRPRGWTEWHLRECPMPYCYRTRDEAYEDCRYLNERPAVQTSQYRVAKYVRAARPVGERR
jgi:hypothetical protein